MKLQNILLAGMMSVVCLASCVDERSLSDEGVSKGEGTLALNVDMLQPASRAVSAVTDYPVDIYAEDGVTVVKSYNTVSAVPPAINLEIGNYVVTSHTPGEIQKKMTTPYYKGTENVEIVKGVKTEAEVICKMINSKINVNYDEAFYRAFQNWEITIDDGSNTALYFTDQDPEEQVIYWYFGDNGAKELYVNFRATNEDGNLVTAHNVLTKEQSSDKYDDDKDNFCGGEVLNLNFFPSVATDGKVTGISINANIVFEETGEEVNVIVGDASLKPDEGGDDPDPIVPPTPGGDDIKLTLPAPISMTQAEAMVADPSTGDVKIECTEGIKSVLVKVNSSSDEMLAQLTEVANQYPGVDLVNGCEVVGNQNLVAFLAKLNKVITVPAEEDESYVFPVGQFYLFLSLLPGNHDFEMIVTDMKDNKKSGVIKVTITE